MFDWARKIWDESKSRVKCTECGKNAKKYGRACICKCGNSWDAQSEYETKMAIIKEPNLKGRDLINA